MTTEFCQVMWWGCPAGEPHFCGRLVHNDGIHVCTDCDEEWDEPKWRTAREQTQ